MKREFPFPLMIDARRFNELAELTGITQTSTALVLAGRLTKVSVGKRDYFRWEDLLSVMSPMGQVRARMVAAAEAAALRPTLQIKKDATR